MTDPGEVMPSWVFFLLEEELLMGSGVRAIGPKNALCARTYYHRLNIAFFKLELYVF
jgi:hypothetical protein